MRKNILLFFSRSTKALSQKNPTIVATLLVAEATNQIKDKNKSLIPNLSREIQF